MNRFGNEVPARRRRIASGRQLPAPNGCSYCTLTMVTTGDIMNLLLAVSCTD